MDIFQDPLTCFSIAVVFYTFVNTWTYWLLQRKTDKLKQEIENRDSYTWFTGSLEMAGIFPCSDCGYLFRYKSVKIYGEGDKHFCASCTEKQQKEQ